MVVEGVDRRWVGGGGGGGPEVCVWCVCGGGRPEVCVCVCGGDGQEVGVWWWRE